MTFLIHGVKATEVRLAPIYPETEVSLIRHSNANVVIVENHQLVALVNAPIMKIVRAIRRVYPTVKLNVI